MAEEEEDGVDDKLQKVVGGKKDDDDDEMVVMDAIVAQVKCQNAHTESRPPSLRIQEGRAGSGSGHRR